MIGLSFGFGVMEICNIFDLKIPFMKGDTSQSNKRVAKLKITLNSVPKIFQLPFNIVLFSGSQYVYSNLNSLAQERPSDDYTNKIIQQVRDETYGDIYIWVLQIFVMMCATLLMDLFRGGGYFTYVKFPHFFRRFLAKSRRILRMETMRAGEKSEENPGVQPEKAKKGQAKVRAEVDEKVKTKENGFGFNAAELSDYHSVVMDDDKSEEMITVKRE